MRLKIIKIFSISIFVLESPEFQDVTRQRAKSKFEEKTMLILKNAYRSVFFLFLLICAPSGIYSDVYPLSFGNAITCSEAIENENVVINQNINRENNLVEKSRKKSYRKHRKLSYYLLVEDFINSFIEIPTSNVLVDSSTISSTYLAGRASVYNLQDEKVGICSASFLCMQNADGIFTDIANYLSIDNGLIVTWFTPTTLINLELDTIVHSMVTECIVVASTKVGFNPFYGQKFNMIVSSDDSKIYFKLSRI